MSPSAALMLEKEIYPIIRNTVPRTVRPQGSEDPEELVQDATASAAEMLEAMEKAGKEARLLFQQLGLTPASRPRITSTKPKAGDEYETFRKTGLRAVK